MRSPDHAERNEDQTINGESLVRDETNFSILDADEEELDDMDVEDDSDLNLLVAMAELDAEAAEAYRIAAEYTDDPLLRVKLEEFRSDHLRHVETFNRLLTIAGVAEVPADLDEDSSAVTMLAASMGTMGVRPTLMAMIANEQLTNAMYEAAMDLPFEDEVARILEMHMSDEQRHLDWLSEQETRGGQDEIDAGARG